MRYTHIMSVGSLEWLVEGWNIFTRNPTTWVAISLLYIITGFTILYIPLVGTLAVTLVWPALTAGLVYGANEIDEHRSLKISHLFEAFRQRKPIRSLLLLGLLLASLVVVHTAVYMLLWSMGTVDYTVVKLVEITVASAVGASLFYVIPAVVVGKARSVQAIKESILVGISNMAAILLFAIVYFALLFAALFPLGLGLLVLIPVTAAAMNACHKDLSVEIRMKHTIEAR